MKDAARIGSAVIGGPDKDKNQGAYAPFLFAEAARVACAARAVCVAYTVSVPVLPVLASILLYIELFQGISGQKTSKTEEVIILGACSGSDHGPAKHSKASKIEEVIILGACSGSDPGFAMHSKASKTEEVLILDA